MTFIEGRAVRLSNVVVKTTVIKTTADLIVIVVRKADHVKTAIKMAIFHLFEHKSSKIILNHVKTAVKMADQVITTEKDKTKQELDAIVFHTFLIYDNLTHF